MPPTIRRTRQRPKPVSGSSSTRSGGSGLSAGPLPKRRTRGDRRSRITRVPTCSVPERARPHRRCTMAETSVHPPARSGRPIWRRWPVGAAVAVILAGAVTGIALSLTGGSASTGQTPAVVRTWLQGHPDVAAWMRDQPDEWTWMRDHWGEAAWMHDRWGAMVWLHAHPRAAG